MAQRFSSKRIIRKLAALSFLLLLTAGALIAWMYRVATADPVVRRTELRVLDLGSHVRLILLSDIHVAGPDMPPSRLRRIVKQTNALQPDVVVIAGDLVSDKRTGTRRYELAEAIQPLGDLRARLGVYSVLGNHDHWRDPGEARAELNRHGIRVLDNDAVRAGPITIGGIDDPFTGHDKLGRTVAFMRSLPRPRILLTHSPDVFPQVPGDVVLTLAGHTHCGQIRLPLIGAVSTMSDFGERYACGRIEENGRTLIVSAGLGTSVLPLRLGAAPDVWVVELRPTRGANSQ